MCDLEHKLKLRQERPSMFTSTELMMAEAVIALRKRITELENELTKERDKNISIINWANACEEHGLRNQKDIVEMAEKCVQLEDENNEAWEKTMVLEAQLSDPDYALVKRLEVQSLYCRFCSLWEEALINGACNCDGWLAEQQGITGMRENASSPI